MDTKEKLLQIFSAKGEIFSCNGFQCQRAFPLVPKVYTEYKYRISPESAHTGLNPPNELQDESRLLRPSVK